MESNVTIIVYAVLLALLGVVYWMVNRKDVLGKKSQTKLVGGFLTRFGRSPHSNPDSTSVDKPDEWAHVSTVLEDMYREFAYKIGELDGRLDQLERDMHEAVRRTEVLERHFEGFTGQMNALAHAEHLDGSLPSASYMETAAHIVQNPFDARYLEVLDRLQRGQDPEVITAEMGISLAEVQQVLAIMMITPNEA